MSNPWSQRGVAYWTDGEGDERIFWGHRQRLPHLRRREDRAAVPRLRPRRRRPGRRDGRPAAARPRGAGLPERDSVRHPLAADRRPRQGDTTARTSPTGASPRRRCRAGCGAWDVRTGEHAWDFHTVPNGARRVRRRYLAERVVALLGQRQRLVDARRRQRAGPRLPADRNDHQRLLRRRPARRQPVLGNAHRPSTWRPGSASGTSRRSTTVCGTTTSRPHPPKPGGRDCRRPSDQGDRAGQQAGLRLRVRPRHRRSDLADRGAPGAAGDEHAGRGAVAHAALPDEAGAVRLPGRHHRRPRRLHPSDPADGYRGGSRASGSDRCSTPLDRPIEGVT